MKWLLALALLGPVVSSHAVTIDVSRLDTVFLNNGDTLTFTLQAFSYAQNAKALGLSPDATMLRFCFPTAPTDATGRFQVTVSSADESYDVNLDSTVGFTAGTLNSASYQGAVSTLQGRFGFTAVESEDLFSGKVVHLSFLNLGQGIELGLPGLLMPHDLFSSLSGDRLTVGLIAASAWVESAPEPRIGFGSPSVLDAPLETAGSAVPEPASAGLMMGGGMLLLGISALLARISRKRE